MNVYFAVCVCVFGFESVAMVLNFMWLLFTSGSMWKTVNFITGGGLRSLYRLLLNQTRRDRHT